MPATTFEEAKLCPKCGFYGTQSHVEPGPRRGSKVYVFTCVTPDCRWEGTGWVVQVNEDGSLPIRNASNPADKEFPALNARQEALAQRQIQEVQE